MHTPPSARLKSDLILLLTATVWGTSFVVQRLASAGLGVFVFNGLRFMLGGLLLLPLIRFHPLPERGARLWSLVAGALLFGASALQQAGIRTTTAANAGFITGLYVILVPFFLVIFWKHRLSAMVWVSALLAVLGIFLLSTGGSLRFAPGDFLVLMGAFIWALHVIVVGWMAKGAQPLTFAVAQFLVCGILNLLVGAFTDVATLPNLTSSWWMIVYTGVFSVAIGYTGQVIGQKHAPPTDAALILSMEAVFAAVFGFLFLREGLSFWQVTGCGLILVAILLIQVQPATAEPHGNRPVEAALHSQEHG
jgi:drug/metabolite transporter (DMT)-like permease